MDTQARVRSDYLTEALSPSGLKMLVMQVATSIRRWSRTTGASFDAIAFRGTSGLLVGPMVAAKLDLYPIVVRKPGDGTHSGAAVEGLDGQFQYIVLDDFIDSGATVDAIRDAMYENRPKAECVGVVLWNRYGSGGWWDNSDGLDIVTRSEWFFEYTGDDS